LSVLEKAILEEVKRILKEEEEPTSLGDALGADEDSDPRESLKLLSQAMDALSREDPMIELVLAPFTAIRDVLSVAVPAVQLMLNDIVLMIKAPLAIRPSSWKRAVREHAKRKAKLTKKYDEAMKASGADSSLASVISFLAMPQAMMKLKVAALPIKATAGVNRALIDSGIRLPLVGILPGAEPPEEALMSDEELDDKKRGELSTKDGIKIALMTLFFAHHSPVGTVLVEEPAKDQNKSPEKGKEVSEEDIKIYLKDTGATSVFEQDLEDLFRGLKKDTEKFLAKEKWKQKVDSVAALLAAKSPEKFIEKGKSIGSAEMKQMVDKYINALKESAQKLANDKKFQQAMLEKVKKEGKDRKDVTEDLLKKESIAAIFAKTHPEFQKELSDSLRKYLTFIVTALESEYPSKDHPRIKIALKNPIVEKAYEEKDEIIKEVINNIPK